VPNSRQIVLLFFSRDPFEEGGEFVFASVDTFSDPGVVVASIRAAIQLRLPLRDQYLNPQAGHGS
jgi:hypothetical protein